ncbi:hypothetical protein [Endothiovibrio diazotrophicus]
MSTITIDDVPAEALRRIERELARCNPGEPVHVTIGNDEGGGRLSKAYEVAKRVSRKVSERGYTEADIAKILAELDD